MQLSVTKLIGRMGVISRTFLSSTESETVAMRRRLLAAPLRTRPRATLPRTCLEASILGNRPIEAEGRGSELNEDDLAALEGQSNPEASAWRWEEEVEVVLKRKEK